MTMHLQQGLSTLNTRKRKVKITKAKMAELEVRWREHNKRMKQTHMHHMRYDTLEEYIDYCYGLSSVCDESCLLFPIGLMQSIGRYSTILIEIHQIACSFTVSLVFVSLVFVRWLYDKNHAIPVGRVE